MNKKIYLTILSIITVLCIIGGSLYHLSDFFMSDFWVISLGDEQGEQTNIGQGRVTYSETHDAFEEIRIDASVLDITIQTGSEYHISYDCVSYLTPEIRTNNNVLIIEQPSVPKINSNNNHCKMTITVPADAKLQSTDIQADVGNIFLNTISSEKAALQADVGNIEAVFCTFTRTDAEADVGAVTFKDCTLDACEASADVGAIAVTNCIFTDLELSGDLGDITVTAPMDLSDYNMKLSVDVGSLTVNGNAYKRSYNQNGSSDKRLHIENELGNVNVKYD